MRPPGREEVEHCYVASKEGEPGAFAVCADIPEGTVRRRRLNVEEWLNCQTRGPFLRNSFKHRIAELRRSATKARKAYRKEYMGKPCEYLADAYDEAADVLQKHLDALQPNAK